MEEPQIEIHVEKITDAETQRLERRESVTRVRYSRRDAVRR